METRRFAALDGLRGVCALSVVLFHANDLFHKGPIFQHGYLAVDMFFMLSGFVIALAHDESLAAGSGLLRFLKLRSRRLLPIYWLGAAFNISIFIWMASSGLYRHDYTLAMIWIVVPITTLIMLPAFGTPGDGFSPAMMNVSWSLMVEWVVNIAYAAGAFRFKTRTLAFVVVGGWLAMSIAGYFTGTGWCVGISRYEVFTFGLLRGAPSFLAGVIIYRLHSLHLFDRLPVIAPEILMTLWLCVAVVPTFTATPTFDWVIVTVFCPMLMIMLIRSEHKAPAFCKQLGALSYPLYAIHPGIIVLAQATPLFGLDRAPNVGRAILVMITCVGAAWFVQNVARLLRMRSLQSPIQIVA
jgi:peptidoglycan/LPS O-acetylase OafA/YrhL